MFLAAGATGAQEHRTNRFVIDDVSFPENVGTASLKIKTTTNFQLNARFTVINGTGATGATIGNDLRDKTSANSASLSAIGFSEHTITIPIINDTARLASAVLRGQVALRPILERR